MSVTVGRIGGGGLMAGRGFRCWATLFPVSIYACFEVRCLSRLCLGAHSWLMGVSRGRRCQLSCGWWFICPMRVDV